MAQVFKKNAVQSVVYMTSQRCAGAAETAHFLRNSSPSEIITVLINSLAAPLFVYILQF